MTRINESIVDVNILSIDGNYTQISVQDTIVTAAADDMLQTVEFGDNYSGGISVLTHNVVTDGTPDFSYILKRFRSGLSELYMFIDTTNTYYINHISGAGFSTIINRAVMRENLQNVVGADFTRAEINSGYPTAIDDLKTQISIMFDSTKFESLSNVYECQINGCSLPLRIYKDIDSVKSSE